MLAIVANHWTPRTMSVPFISSSKNSAINSRPYSWMGTSVYLTWHSKELPLPTITWKAGISVATKFKPSINVDLMKLWVLPPLTNITTGFPLPDLDTLSVRGWYTPVMVLRLISVTAITGPSSIRGSSSRWSLALFNSSNSSSPINNKQETLHLWSGEYFSSQ